MDSTRWDCLILHQVLALYQELLKKIIIKKGKEVMVPAVRSARASC